MRLMTYLSFNGDCRAAFNFYARILGAKVSSMMTFGESPACDHVPAEAHALIMHARLELGAFTLMGTDASPGHPYPSVKGAHVVLDVDDPKQAEWLFAALAENGRIEMPMAKTFWAERYGIAVDRFGVPWMVNCAPTA